MNAPDMRRRGFTLIEIMIVLVIIAMLVGLTSIAAMKVLDTMKRTVMLNDLSNLTNAIRMYKDAKKEFPPAMADADLDYRKERLMQHLRYAYPRFTPGGATVYEQYAALRTYIYDNYNQLDLDKLDQAEALVFWLGGPPTPMAKGSTTVRASNRRLFGFHGDVSNPFRRDLPPDGTPTEKMADFELRGRSQALYDFEDGRLTDVDNDGWLEYGPPGENMAPYVYYDAKSYMRSSATADAPPFRAYPNALLTTSAKYDELYTKWGLAVPLMYATTESELPASLDFRNSSIRWNNPDSYQIISCGLDGLYGYTLKAASSDSPHGDKYFANNWKLTSFPFQRVYSSTSDTSKRGYDEEERDNLISFSSSTVDDGKVQ